MRTNVSTVVAKQLPEFIREDYQGFTAFIEAYYKWLHEQQISLEDSRDLDNTLDEYIKYFKKELAVHLPNLLEDERTVLPKIKDLYLAKGSEASYKLLFRLMFGKNVELTYPGQQMLKASDGTWNQEISIFARVDYGDPDIVIGKLVDIVTGTRVIRVLVDRREILTGEVDRIVALGGNIYEFYLDKRFFGEINVGDKIKYKDLFQAEVLPATQKPIVRQPGKNFRVGQVFEVNSGSGTGALVKVTQVDQNGGIKYIELIKFGIGYSANFGVQLLPTSSINNRLATDPPSFSTLEGWNLDISDRTPGFDEQGYINNGDYWDIGETGSGATATATLSSKFVTGTTITNGGSGYLTTPTVTFSAPPSGVTAVGVAVVVGGVVKSITITNAGSGYTSAPTVTITGTGSGSLATATATIGASIASINIINGGSGYTLDSPVIDICVPLDSHNLPIADAVTAQATLTRSGGVITGATITNAGSGYLTAPLVIIRGAPGYADGAYAGTVRREYALNYRNAAENAEDPAQLAIELGALVKYPGYYTSNNGFLDDSVKIQDSFYYQKYSYVLKIDEKLSTYKSAVKSLLHPAGMALFGEYNINNQFDLSIALECVVKALGIGVEDELDVTDAHVYLSTGKSLGSQYLFNGVTPESTQVVMGDAMTRRLDMSLGSQYLYGGLTSESTRTAMSDAATVQFTKALSEASVGTFNEVITFSTSKSLADASIGTLTETVTFSSGKALSDSISTPTDATYLSLDKSLADTSVGTISDSATLLFTKYVVDTTVGTWSDALTLSIGKSLSDSIATPTDSLVRSVGKSLSDSQNMSDSATTSVTKYVEDTTVGTWSNSGKVWMNSYQGQDYYSSDYSVGLQTTFTN